MRYLAAAILSIHFIACTSDVEINVATTEQKDTKIAPCRVHLELLATTPNNTGSNGQASFIIGNLGIASTQGGTEVVQIVDFSDENNIIARGEYNPLGHGLLDLYAEGNTVYGSSISGELHSININDPDNPVNLDTLSIPGESWGMVAKGNYLYIGNYSSGLNIIDKSSPSNLTSVNTVPGYPLMHMQIEDNILLGRQDKR